MTRAYRSNETTTLTTNSNGLREVNGGEGHVEEVRRCYTIFPLLDRYPPETNVQTIPVTLLPVQPLVRPDDKVRCSSWRGGTEERIPLPLSKGRDAGLAGRETTS